MSRFFPHTTYAEDQPLSHTILTTHVLHRGFTSGALLGSTVLYPVQLYRARRSGALNPPPTSLTNPPITSPSASSPVTSPIVAAATTRTAILLRATASASLVTTALMGLALAGRMRGRDDIEWQDRSWRLQANEGQVLVDDFCVVGAAAGVLSGVAGVGGGVPGWRGVVGRAGLGSVAGTVLYLGWRYGFGGGKGEKSE